MAFNHKRADFWLPNFEFKRSLLSLLNVPRFKVEQSLYTYIYKCKVVYFLFGTPGICSPLYL